MTDDAEDAPAAAEPGEVRLRSIARSLPVQLLRAREAVMERFRATLRLHNVTEQQWRLLRTLSASDGMEVSELAEASFLLAPSVSRILRDLEARGYLRKERVARDHRRARVSITPAGLALIDTVAPRSEAIHREIADAFGEERMRRIERLLDELTEAMRALPPVHAAPPEECPAGTPPEGLSSRAEPE